LDAAGVGGRAVRAHSRWSGLGTGSEDGAKAGEQVENQGEHGKLAHDATGRDTNTTDSSAHRRETRPTDGDLAKDSDGCGGAALLRLVVEVHLGSAVAGGADAEGGVGVQSVLYTAKSASGTLNAEVLNARIMSRSGSGSRVLLFIQR